MSGTPIINIHLRNFRLKYFTSKQMRRDLQKIYQEEGKKVGMQWLRHMLPIHFLTQAYGRYHFLGRSRAYVQWKINAYRVNPYAQKFRFHDSQYLADPFIRKPQDRPLVLLGQLQDRTQKLTERNVEAKSPWWRSNAAKEEVNIRIRIPIGHPISPKIADSTHGEGRGEVGRTNASERKVLGELFCLSVWRRLQQEYSQFFPPKTP